MRLRSYALASAAVAVLLGVFSTNPQADLKQDLAAFNKVWNDKKSINLDKMKAIESLPRGDAGLTDTYTTILESDVWQYRAEILTRITTESDSALLDALAKWLFDPKQNVKKPAAAEHVAFALLNNQKWATPENWQRAGELVAQEKLAEKVKARVIRELGRWRFQMETPEQIASPDAQGPMKANARILVSLLSASAKERKPNVNLRFLIADALENISGEEFGYELDKWEFWIQNLKDTDMLAPRTPSKFKDQFTDVEIEGHSFVRRTARPTDLEILILPDLGKSEQYWYPYIFELNKTFKCTFVDLPDCSRMAGLEWMRNRDGSENRTAYYYPLKQLVEAFEARREASKQKKIALIAHGVSGWIALEYLNLHPESVSFAVILETWSGKGSREQARLALEGSKDEAYKYHGQDLIYDPTGRIGSLSLNEEQKMWSGTGAFKRRWADPKALEPIFYAQRPYQKAIEGSARILVPEYEFKDAAKGKKIDVPVLFIHGAMDPMFVKDDEKEYRRSLVKATWSVFANSADTPWAEEPVLFFETFNKLLEDHKILEELKKQKEKEKDK